MQLVVRKHRICMHVAFLENDVFNLALESFFNLVD